MIEDWLDQDLDKTIRDFDYTRRAVRHLNRVVYADNFEDMDGESIFRFLMKEMEIVSFKDFLRRYIYEKAMIDVPFRDISDEEYKDIILGSFRERNVPFSFSPTSKRPSASVKDWLRQDSVKRGTIFLLGFGLGMSEKDVSEFLTKVVQEEDFDFTDPQEVIFWHCFSTGAPYRKAMQLLTWYEGLDETKQTISNKSTWQQIIQKDDYCDNKEKYLKEFLQERKNSSASETEVAREVFLDIYKRVCQVISRINEEIDGCPLDTVTPADIEKIICSGIPITGNGNLKKMSVSKLARHFQNKRLTRQRLDGLLKGKQKVNRTDLITLLFLIYHDVEKQWPTERYLQYLREANELLEKCHMMGIYPANSYEAFILICLLTEDPLANYSEVLEKSYSLDESEGG